MCINEEQRRIISSTITGQIYNTMGDEWQELADTLHQLALAHGAPSVRSNWMIHVYDDAGSAKKFINYLEALNKVQPVNHIRVIEYIPRPQPQPQPIV